MNAPECSILSISTLMHRKSLMICTAGIFVFLSYKIIGNTVERKQTIEKVTKKSILRKQNQDELEKKLEKIKDIEKWDYILSLQFEELSQKLRTGALNSLDTLHAYQWKAIQLNNKLNCVVYFLDDAESEAIERDKILHSDRKMLHGLPISIKECFHVKGCDSTAGLTQFLFKPNSKDGTTVSFLRKHGAIPFCLTNVPQTMKAYQCSNPCFGATSNPCEPSRECGGSSGGEGSLIGGGGSILGIGSDIGGSLRCPAALCGIASLKPTPGRDISKIGYQTGSINHYSHPFINSVSGFMSSSVAGLVAGYKTFWNDKEMSRLDASLINMPWRDSVFESTTKLRVGYSLTDGYFEAHPGCKRAVVETIKLLEECGHETVLFDPPDMNTVVKIYAGLMYADKFKDMRNTLRYSQLVDSSMKGIVKFYYLLNWTPKWVLAWVINPILKRFTKSEINPALDTIEKIFHCHLERQILIQNYLDKMNENNIDLLVFPASLLPAPKKEYSVFTKAPILGSAWITWNVFEFPAGIIPITVGNQEDEDNLSMKFPTNDRVYRLIKESSKNGIGLPLAVQIVGRKYEEELILRLMKELEKISK